MIGGLHQVRIVRPAGVPMRFGLHGGATRVTFDREMFDAVGGTLECTSDGFDANDPGFDLHVTGGASRLTIGAAGASGL